MRVLRMKSDGRIIEAQDGDNEDGLPILLQNCRSSGLNPDDCESLIMADSEFNAALAEQQEQQKTYAQKRRAEYPPLEDQIEALIEGGAKLDALRLKISAIKAKHPKPS